MRKLLVIGLDGASPFLIESWKDDLVNMANVSKDGVHGILKSSVPPSSCPAWNCFNSGKNPGKIGVFGYQQAQFDVHSKPTLVNSTTQDSPSIWEMLSEIKVKTGVIHVPITYPPRKVNGFMVCGYLTPPGKDYTYPSELAKEIESVIKNYKVEIDYTPPEYMRNREIGFLNEAYRTLEGNFKVAKYLMGRYDWDFLIVVFTILDRIQHYFWHHMDRKHPKHDPAKEQPFKGIIKNCYEKIDFIVGELLRMADDETNLMIMSDHGFGPEYGCFHINNWLREENLLRMRKESTGNRSRLPLDFLGEKRILKAITRLALYEKVRTLHLIENMRFIIDLIPSRLRMKHPFLRTRAIMGLDWSRTKAYSFGDGFIYINLKGRESEGIVCPGREYKNLREKIIRKLKQVKLPNTNKKIVASIYKKGEIYSGKHVDVAPDLIVLGDEISLRMGSGYGELFEIPGPQSGNHRSEGIWMMRGPDVKSNLRIDADIFDLAPTILYLMGSPIPKDMDGNVLREALTIERDPMYDDREFEAREQFEYSREEEEEIKKSLKALGYID